MINSATPPPPATWLVESKSAWISAASRLRIPVPCNDGTKFLAIEFEVLTGGFCDFDVMLEADDESATRLYGPTRRARGVRTCVPLPHAGVAYVTFDNYSSWLASVEVRYTLRGTATEPPDTATYSRLRFSNLVEPEQQPTGGDGGGSGGGGASELFDDGEEEARRALDGAPVLERVVAAGDHEQYELHVAGRSKLYVSVDVVRGRDVDFGIMFKRDAAEAGEAQAEIRPIRVFGPCRRATSLSATVLVPCAGTLALGFDNSGMWISKKTVKFRVRAENEAL